MFKKDTLLQRHGVQTNLYEALLIQGLLQGKLLIRFLSSKGFISASCQQSLSPKQATRRIFDRAPNCEVYTLIVNTVNSTEVC